MVPGEIRKFEVFTTLLYDGFICDNLFMPDVNQLRDVIDQLFSGLEQLIRADKCHNDLKPTNILYKYSNGKYSIKIGDFAQCGTQGGTPGWTAPVFLKNRNPGKEDMYSVGLIILRLLCRHQLNLKSTASIYPITRFLAKSTAMICPILSLNDPDQDLFHCLRDNFVENNDITQQWMVDFKNMTEIKFVMRMMNLDNQPTFDEINKEWHRIKSGIKMIDTSRLSQLSVPRQYLQPQYIHTKLVISKMIGKYFFSVHGKFDMSMTDHETLTSTRTHAQGDSELCWLYSMSTSLRRSIKIFIGIGLTVYQVKV